MNKIMTEPQRVLYGERLKEMRKTRGYTLETLAATVKTSKQTLSNIEKGKYKSVNVELLNSLASNLSCTADYLIGLSKEPHKTAPIDGIEYINPIIFEYTAAPLKNRLFDLCGGDNIELLDKMVTFLEKAPAKYKKAFGEFLDSFTKLI